jgi:transcriptional regulator with XRE-family HTH domain
MPKLGDRIREARIARGMSQQDLAKLMQTNQPQIARWESAGSMGSSNLALLARALGLTLENLLTGVWPETQVCGRCKQLLVPGDSLRLGSHPKAPQFCTDCVKTYTKECLEIKDKALEVLK